MRRATTSCGDALRPGGRLSAQDATAIARADLDYLERLLATRDLAAVLAVPLPRAADVPGMDDHHRDNCAAVMRAQL